MNTIELLLPKKGRPLFMGKLLLERIHFNNQYKKMDESYIIPKEELLANKLGLKIFANMLIESSKFGILRTEKDYDKLTSFPLFLDFEFVKEWEIKKPWKKFDLKNYILTTYEEKLNSNTPSIAYNPNECGYANAVWKAYFLNAPLVDLMKILDTSIMALDNYIENRPEVQPTVLEYNISELSKYLKLEHKDIFALYWTTILFDSNLNHIDNLLDYTLKFSSYKTEAFFAIIENALECAPESILSRLTHNKPITNFLFYNPVIDQHTGTNIIKSNMNKNWSMIWDEIVNPLYRENIKHNFNLNNQSIISQFIKQNSNKTIDLKNWDYLNGIISIWKTQLMTGSTKILFYGSKGCGKTSLSLSLLNSLNLNIFSPIDETVNNYKLAKQMINQFDNSALYVNEMKDLLKDNKLFQNVNFNIIWNVDKLDDIPEKVLEQFDYVYNLSEIPVENRLEFSRIKFKDENLAIKIAQQLKTFGSIEQASKLVKNEKDWKTIYPHINIEKKNTGNSFEVVDYNTFKDIPDLVGYKDLYTAFNTILDLFNNPYKYERVKAKTPKGFLIEGAPGTGKTLFVKHIAKKSQLPLIVANSSQLANNIEEIKELFNYARNMAPCILFFDEIDTLLTNPVTPFRIDTEKQKILNTMLSEIDGITGLAGVVIIGTTNHVREISPIALRSGRISEIISVSIPTNEDRKEIWKSYLSLKPIESIDYNVLSKMTDGFSGADIAEAANQSALMAAYEGSELITRFHLDQACENVTFGRKNGQIVIDPKALWNTAIHEVGHALIAMNENKEVNRVTIIPRQHALGITQILKEEGFHTYTKKEMEGLICIYLGGIVAEKIIFNDYESGGSSDLEFIKKNIYHGFLSLGFSENIGPVASNNLENVSESRKMLLENECSDLAKKLFEKTEKFLTHNKDVLIECAEELLKYKSLSIDSLHKWKEKIKQPELK